MNDKDALLQSMRDVELPVVPWSIAPGWWALLLLLVLIVIAFFAFTRRRKTRLWQRQARTELEAIRERLGREPSVALLSKSSQLARKVVLAVEQREDVSALHGEAWLEKLDDVCGRPEFTQGIGRLLLDQPYQKQPVVASTDLSELLDSVDVLISSAGNYHPQKPNPDEAETDTTKRSRIAS